MVIVIIVVESFVASASMSDPFFLCKSMVLDDIAPTVPQIPPFWSLAPSIYFSFNFRPPLFLFPLSISR